MVKITRVSAGSIRESSMPLSPGIWMSQKSRSTGRSRSMSKAAEPLLNEPHSVRNGVLRTYPAISSTASGSSSMIAQFSFIVRAV